MTPRQSTPSSEHSAHSDGNVRKRVCKACDRCRLKKSKCDGANPCSRCRADNAICVFGERKKAHDKIYPKGYVEMLEQQQVWLVNGLQELYRRAQEGEAWVGEPLKAEPNGHPLTHDLLTRLGALDHTQGEQFEENVDSMQQKLWKQNAGSMQRQESSDGSLDIAYSPPPTMNHINNNSYNNNNNNSHHRHHHSNSTIRRHHPYTAAQLADAMQRHQHQHLPPTPPSYSPTSSSASAMARQSSIIKSESLISPSLASTSNNNISNYANLMPNQQSINPMALQNPQGHQQPPPWAAGNPSSAGNSGELMLDDLDLLGSQYAMFEETSSSMFGRQQQMPINCLPPSVLFEGNEEFNQYFNTNTEIPTI